MAKRMMTRATGCTLIRVILTPFVLLAIIHNRWLTAAILFSCAAITDLLDGIVARKYKEESSFGAWVDTIADKLLILPTLFTLMYYCPHELLIPSYFFGFMASKEIIIALGALILSGIIRRFVVRPTMLGKVTIFCQMVLICCVLLMIALDYHVAMLAYGLMAVVGTFIIITAIHYTISWIRVIALGMSRC